MKKLLLLLPFVLLCGAATAQSGDSGSVRTEKQPSRFIFGVSYRFSLGVLEHIALKGEGIPNISDNGVPYDMKGGAFLLGLGCNITDNWSALFEFGIARYAGSSSVPLLGRVQYFYGNDPDRWFNYAELGATIDDGSTMLLAGLGGGYRFKLGRRTCLDLSAGLELLRGSYDTFAAYNEEVLSCKLKYARLGLTFGVGFVF